MDAHITLVLPEVPQDEKERAEWLAAALAELDAKRDALAEKLAAAEPPKPDEV